ncbi:hypothetical protein I302_109063 [Kwoniella bestiolae CBS 10118]|uniref:Uncharacterized protein n=1 Tax=Kwoniella bestiolae CBS 10118 TaxID=1296100 RepID=A0A1B9FUW0_9TREE|nr:hypothetical protein I302_08207 [Kwoniella bestiolae CBS 10118]OCF22557.1 hypothetical protein I302_08207 [Kwoniella bestiolae CBS 10118]
MPAVHTHHTSPRSIQSIVIVLFIVLVAYVFFNGRKKKEKWSGYPTGDVEEDLESGRRRSRGEKGSEGSDRKDSGDRDRGRERDGSRGGKGKDGQSDSDSSSSKKDSGKKDGKKDRKKKKKEPLEWAQPPSAPPVSAAPDHRTATPKKSAFRKRGPDDSLPPSPNTQAGNGVRWVDTENNLKSPVTKHFRKWEDHMGTTDDSNELFKNGTYQQKDKSKKLPFPSRWSSNEIVRLQQENEKNPRLKDKNMQLPDDILEMMRQVEQISQAKPADAQLWQLALQDSWDNDYGNLPKVPMTVAKELSKFVTKKEIDTIEAKMKERVKLETKPDSKRKFEDFVNGLGVKRDTPEWPYKFTLGWYMDTYRAKDYKRRMIIDNKNVNMTGDPECARVSFILGWLEYIGELNKAQRLFIGWDLYGLTLRAQAMKENNAHYRLDLTIFLPCESEDPTEWAMRFQESCLSFRHFHSEMLKNFNNTSNDFMDDNAFKRRRLIFRPGWTVKGVDINKSSDPTPDQSIAQRTLIRRDPKVINIPSQGDVDASPRLRRLQSFATIDPCKKALSQLAPGEVAVQELRQFYWDQNSLTKQNNSLTPETFWLAYQIAGDRLQYEMDPDEFLLPRTTYDFIRSFDLGSYVPFQLVLGERKFLPIQGFPALELVIISYIPLGQDGSTVELILDPRFGLTQQLEIEKKPTRHLNREPIRLKLFVAISDIRLTERIRDDLDRFFAFRGNSYLREGMAKSHIRDTIRGTVFRILDNVYIVDESSASTAQEGRLPKGMPLGYEPRFPPELMGDETSQARNPFGPPGMGSAPPTPTPTGHPPPPSPGGGGFQSPGSGFGRPSPFGSDIQRPPAPGPSTPHGPFNPPPPPPTPPSNTQGPPRPQAPPQFTDPRRAQAQLEEARRTAENHHAQQSQQSNPNPNPNSNYRPPSVVDADEEDEPMTQGTFGNLRNPDGRPFNGDKGEKGRELPP